MESEPSNLHESLWRRKPSDTERAKLRGQPELAAEARPDGGAGPDPECARGLQFHRARDGRDRAGVSGWAARARGWRWSWRFLVPRVAVAAALLVFTGVNVQHYEASAHRSELVRTVAMVATGKSAPSVDALKDMDAIVRMSQSAHADGDLLAAFQQ